jgi:hypothetical protein
MSDQPNDGGFRLEMEFHMDDFAPPPVMGQGGIRLPAPPCLSGCKLTDNHAGGSYERKKKI